MGAELDRRKLQIAALRWIAQLPFIQADDIGRLTGQDRTKVRTALDTLTRIGWIEGVSAHSPEFEAERRLFVLREIASQPFINALQLTPDEVQRYWPIGRAQTRRRLAQLEITTGVDSFLAGVVAGYRADPAITVGDVRWLPRVQHRFRRWSPHGIEAYGYLRCGATFAHFLIAWDRAEAPTVHRRTRVTDWYRTVESRDRQDAGKAPTILLVCPTRYLEEEWAEAVDAVANRRGRYPLDVAVATTDDVLDADPTNAIWRRLGDSGEQALTDQLAWVDAPPPFPEHAPLSYELVQRGVATQRPPLSRWARRTAASGHPSKVHDYIAALALVLGARQKAVLKVIAEHPYLSVVEIAQVLGERPSSIGAILTGLARYGLIAAINVPRESSAR